MFRCRAMTRLATLAAMRMVTIIPVPMPALSPTMEKGKITEWCKKIGEQVNNSDTFCKVETDKAVVSYDNSGDEGYMARVLVQEGSETEVGQTICLMVEDAADVNSAEVANWSEGGSSEAAGSAAASTATEAAPAAAAAAAPAAPRASSGDRVKASPLAKKMAAEKNIALDRITGTGGGVNRITAKDVESAASSSSSPAAAAAPAPAARSSAAAASSPAAKTAPAAPARGAAKPAAPAANANYVDIPVTNMRAVIAKRLHQSKNLDVPHYYIFGECRVDNALALLKQLNLKGNGEYKLTMNDYIIKAVARANLLTPEVNAAWYGDFIRQYSTVDVSVAVATPTGLITPIIRNAHAKGLVEVSKEVKSLAKRARENALKPEEFQGGTVSVSNLGASNVRGFTAIINPPQALIVAVGTGMPRPQVARNAETNEYEVTGKVEMVATFNASFDHRVVDGAVGAKWYQGFRDAMENPLSLLL